MVIIIDENNQIKDRESFHRWLITYPEKKENSFWNRIEFSTFPFIDLNIPDFGGYEPRNELVEDHGLSLNEKVTFVHMLNPSSERLNGMGKYFMKRIEDRSIDMNSRVVVVGSYNHSYGFYKHIGYVPIGRRVLAKVLRPNPL